ncbi:hypothetical protein [Sedimenticola selenatireducens]|uniref:Bacteriophage tail tape measure C-terminal domain-containing protein n=1 Tax=Sedimenticola selenatireducens TaxID=191960 RepID=A0A557SCJ7_9GAMM|nr:hypothetical protein [Sedimenticola selenatireducens]TVO75142.1 hypothetical protein FHP88_09010 [Sedimenticola selenatireducens]TVT67003.1 MAG: hypothetical protein FHK78_01345 [Sedimenticola selenatireducens]
MTDLAKLVVSLEAESSKLRTDLEKAQKHLDRFEKSADRASSIAKKGFIGLATVLPLAGLAAAAKSSLDFADAISVASDKTGFSVKSLQELRFAAEQTGVGISVLDGGLGRFTKRLGLARAGTGAAADTYKKLGIDLKQSNEQVFRQVVNTLGDMDDQTNRLALTTRLFGDDAQSLATTFKNGTAGLDDFADKARGLGIILDDDLVEGAAAANEQLGILKQVINAQTTKIFVELAPAIISVGNALSEAAPKVANFFGAWGDVEHQTLGALDETIENIKAQIAEETNNAKRVATDSPNWAEYLFGFNETEEEVNQKVDSLIERYWKAVSRKEKLLKQKDKNPNSAVAGVDVSGLFSIDSQDTEASKAAKRVQEQYDAALESLNQTVALLGVTTQYEKTLWDVQKGRYKDLNDNQKKALLDAAQRIDQKTADIESTKEAAKAEEEAAKSAERLNEQLEAQAKRWRDLVNPANGVNDQMAELDLLLEKGKISWDTYGDAMFEVMGGLEDEAKKTEDKWKDLGLTFSSAFEDAIVNGQSLSDVLAGLEQDITRIVTRKLVTEPLGDFFTGFAKSFIPSFDGGGFTGLGSRTGGLDGKGGYLSILHPNETVIDHTKSSRQSSGMRVVNNITVSAPNGQISTESMNQLQTKLAKSMQRSLARNT